MNTAQSTSGDGQIEQLQRERPQQPRDQPREQLPTRDYAALVAVFNGALAAALLARKCAREPLPERVEPRDLALSALATQKLSRVMTKDKVTSAFRAPFTEVELTLFGLCGESALQANLFVTQRGRQLERGKDRRASAGRTVPRPSVG